MSQIFVCLLRKAGLERKNRSNKNLSRGHSGSTGMSARALKEVKGRVMLEMFCESHEINVRETVMLMMRHGVRKLHRLRKMS